MVSIDFFSQQGFNLKWIINLTLKNERTYSHEGPGMAMALQGALTYCSALWDFRTGQWKTSPPKIMHFIVSRKSTI